MLTKKEDAVYIFQSYQKAQWVKRLARDQEILTSMPSDAEHPLWEWAPHITPSDAEHPLWEWAPHITPSDAEHPLWEWAPHITPSDAEHPLWEWAPHIIPSTHCENELLR